MPAGAYLRRRAPITDGLKNVGSQIIHASPGRHTIILSYCHGLIPPTSLIWPDDIISLTAFCAAIIGMPRYDSLAFMFHALPLRRFEALLMATRYQSKRA